MVLPIVFVPMATLFGGSSVSLLSLLWTNCLFSFFEGFRYVRLQHSFKRCQ